jgi:Lar family restriction alleviation protein
MQSNVRQEPDRSDASGITNLQLTREDNVLPCPFCGGTDIELRNTHTASYWMACMDCGAEHHGGQGYGLNFQSHKVPLRCHKLAKASTLKAWNRRPSGQNF